MHYAGVLPLLSSALLLGGLVTAVPVADKPKKHGNCGTVTKTVTTVITVPPSSSTTSTCNGSGQQVCWDGVNECGQMYGGCFPDCTPWPTFTAPPCSSGTCNGSGQQVCWDGVNECGQWYGGCFPDCSPWPTFTAPPCSTTSSVTSTSNSTCNGSGQQVCWDGVNECGQWYGGCFPDCSPWPTFTAPPCSTASTTTTSTSNSTCDGSGQQVCWDGINECGQMYGGCFPDCKPWPTFTAPPCSTNTIPTVTYTATPV